MFIMLFVFPILSFFPPLLLGVDLLEDLLLEDLTLTEEAEDFPDVFPEEVDLPREDLLLLLSELVVVVGRVIRVSHMIFSDL